MAARIPHHTKNKGSETLAKWMSRDNIAINNNIASGSVSNIIHDFKDKEIPDIDLLREVAVALKRENLDLIQFASSMRLRKMLDNLEFPKSELKNS